jgi:signal transduction histidine kinase
MATDGVSGTTHSAPCLDSCAVEKCRLAGVRTELGTPQVTIAGDLLRGPPQIEIGADNVLARELCDGAERAGAPSVPRGAGTSPQQNSDPVSRAAEVVASDFLATLLAMASHDLRQPLQLIVSAHDVLTTMRLDNTQREQVAQAAIATKQLTGMLGQLVEAVQLHERSHDGLGVPVPLQPMLDGLSAEFAEPARLKGITLRITAARIAALSHPVLLISILRNLIRNAIDYTPREGSVFVAVRRCGAELRIDVRDTGTGIRPHALARIFEAFERADARRTDGLGLGLFIVKRAADLLGHRVEVRSAEGRGSCFTVVARAAECELMEIIRSWPPSRLPPSAALRASRVRRGLRRVGSGE